MSNNTNSLNLKVEQFEYFKLDNHLSKLDISRNVVIFFDLENNQDTNQHIKNNFQNLKVRFKEINLNFVYESFFTVREDYKNIIDYYIPFLSGSKNQYSELSNDSDLPESKIIVDYLGYKGNIKSGFLFFNHDSCYEYAYVVEYNEAIIQTNSEELNHLLEFIRVKNQEEHYDYMIDNSFNSYDNLDEETLAKINEIQNQLYELKKSGQFLFALPMLKQILSNEVNNSTKSNLIVDKDYRILLPNFNNLEIQLSHLTKAIYILFYNNPQGLNIKQLHLYKKQLLELYSNISYQIDYNKIQQSVEDLVKPEGKGIYTHLARIKSAFCKQMDFEFAKNYIVVGSTFGSDMKYIPILKETHCQDLQNSNSLSSGITKPFTDVDVSELFDSNEFKD